MIQLKNISLFFDQVVLKKVNLKIDEGETIGIVGRSGAGKSSLLAVIAGKITPQSGQILFRNKELPKANELLIPGYSFVQLVEQKFNLDLYHTVYENVHLKANYLSYDKRNGWVIKILKILGLHKVANQKAITLSGGEQQRLAIARALASKPSILLLDEPFAHLDELLKSKLQNYIYKLKQETDCTLVLVSHDGSDLLAVSDQIVHLKNGILSKKVAPDTMYFTPKNQEQAELFGFWNQIQMQNKKMTFRPNQYHVVKSNGIRLNDIYVKFKGNYYENYCSTEFGNFVLNSIHPLLKGIQIVIQK